MRSMPSSRRTLASRSSTTRILALRISAEFTMAYRPVLFAMTGLLPGKLHHCVQSLRELIHPDGFGEIAEESGLQALLDVAWHGVGTEGNHGNVRRFWVFAKNPQGFNATDARQIDVHQDHFRLVGARQLDTPGSVGRAAPPPSPAA